MSETEKEYMYEVVKPIDILVIGNGFDLAHGLKTTYYDFLDFCDSIRKFRSSPSVSTPIDKKRREQLMSSGKDMYVEFNNLLDSFWILHFGKRREAVKNAWISFESEIEKVIFDEYKHFQGKKNNAYGGAYTSSLSRFISDRRSEIKTNQDVFILLYDELKKLDRALEIYLDKVASRELEGVKELGIITGIAPDYVLSFNYTSTFSRLYGEKETCYIHGIADADRNPIDNNMILGYDKRYLEDSENYIEGIPFQKYYQRIVKHTDNNYYDWLGYDETLDKWRRRKIYIHFFGHSLSPEDGDVIRLLVTNEMAYTKIYYRKNHQGDLESLVKNLAYILGREDFNKLAGGRNPRIVFESFDESK